MNMKLIMTGAGILMPLVMMILGWLMIRKAPKRKAKIAYRTKWSQKSKETWYYAHSMLGKVWLGLGTTLLVVSVGVLIIAQIGNEASVRAIASTLATTQLTLWILTVVPVEVMLRRRFDKHGERKVKRW